MEQIDKYQLAAMIILFEVGSSSLFQLGANAKQDAWIAILLSAAIGLVMLCGFLYIRHLEAKLNFVEILQQHYGKWFGSFIASAYCLYFSYESMRNARDFGDLMITTFLSETPMYFIILVLIVLSGYAVFKGVEVFFRTVEFLLLPMLISYVALAMLFFSSDIVRARRILPVLENGILPVLKATPGIVMFPFGQMVLFLVFWHFVSDKTIIAKVSIISYLTVGGLLLMFNMFNIMILGAPIAAISSLPLLHSVRLVAIGSFLERIDALIVLLLFVALFIKTTLWYLGTIVVLGQLWRRLDQRWFVIPVGAVIYAASFLEPNYIYHIWLGIEIVTTRVHPFFQIFFPVLLLIIILLKKHISTGLSKHTK
jgi:spore germination protein KB